LYKRDREGLREDRAPSFITNMVLGLFFTSLLSLLITASTTTYAADVNYVFNLQNSVVAPDGFSRAGVIVNDIFPGTLIQANKDDTLHITVNDQLTDPTMRYVTSKYQLRGKNADYAM
jgi:hypothetical protein